MELHLTDGTVFAGQAFGAHRTAHGEVVFHTGMSGYVETLTDPSYRGQILVTAFPSLGNYGVSTESAESSRIQVGGLVVAHKAAGRGDLGALRSLDEWLQAEGIPAVEGIDTRALIDHLRAHGPLVGRLLAPGAAPTPAPLVPQELRSYPGGSPSILVIDLGAKESLIRSISQRGATVLRAPASFQWERLLPAVDGIVLSNGPGDPASLGEVVARVRPLLDLDLPVLGVCLGHQLLARAAGAETYRLPIGHRSLNQPVLDRLTNRGLVTSQNHGFAVSTESLPPAWETRFINLHDGSNEGIAHRERPFLGVQFHPESTPGPRDAEYLLDEFVRQASLRGRAGAP